MRPSTTKATGWLIAAVAAPSLLLAADPLAALVKNSPFGAVSLPAAAQSSALEFRGVFADGDESFFSIHDPATRTSHWVALNEPGLPYILRSYDVGKQTVVADHQGRSLLLILKKTPSVAAVASPSTVPMPLPAPGTQPEVNLTAGPPEEAARLAAIATEIRRRRQLRQKPQAMAPPPGSQP